MSSRISYALAVVLLLAAAALRLWQLTALPPGLHSDEIDNVLITELVRQGDVRVFYNRGGEGHEGLTDTALAAVTSLTGRGLLGYRLFFVWVGMLTLALTYTLARQLYGPLAGLAALALLGVSMWPVLLSRMVAHEGVLMLLVAAILLALVLGLPVAGRFGTRIAGSTPFTALGLLLGLGLYIHPNSLLLILFAMLFIVYMLLSRRRLARRTLGYLGLALVMMMVIAMPYVISSIRLPELSGASRIFDPFSDGQPPLEAALKGLAGFFLMGDPDPRYNLPGRPLIDLVSGLLLIVGLLTALRLARRPRYALPLIALLILLPVALLSRSPSFLAFTPLLPLVALLFGLGVCTIYNSLQPGARRVAAFGLLVLLVFNLVWTGRDLFGGWRLHDDVQTAYNGYIAQLAHHLDRTVDSTPTVVCAGDLTALPAAEPTASQLLALMMSDRNPNLRYASCGTGLVFTNGGERQQVVLTEPGMLDSVHPVIHEWLAQGEAADGVDGVVIMNVSDPLASTVGRFTTTAPVLYAPEAPGGESSTLPPVRFGDYVTFLGYEPRDLGTFAPGDVVTVVTYWRVDGPIPPNLRLFTHILSDPVAIASQTDTISVQAGNLQPRDVFVQVTLVPLPRVIPDGEYRLSIGAYRDAPDDRNDTRLEVFEGERPRGTRLFLNRILVAQRPGG